MTSVFSLLGINKRLRADFAWVLSGNVLYSACQWGIVLLLAKLGTPEQVGEYALGMAIAAPIVLFANCQLRALLASDVSDRFTLGQYLTFRLLSLGLALGLIACLALWTQSDRRLALVVLLVGFAQLLEYVSDLYYGWMQRHDRMDRMSASLMIKGPLSLAALCAAMLVTHDVAWAIAGLALGRAAVLLAWDARLGFTRSQGVAPARGRLQWHSGAMARLLRMALPLGIISTLGTLNTSVPRYFVQAHSGSAELGIFSAIASLLSIGNLVISAFGQAIFLPVAKSCAAFDRPAYRRFILQCVVLGGLLGGGAAVVATLAGRQILTAVFRPEYGQRADIFALLMVAGALSFTGSGLGYVMTAARSLAPQIPVLAATVIAAVAGSAWLVPRYGLWGAAEAVLISAAVQLAGSAFILLGIDRQLRREAGAVAVGECERLAV